MQIDCPRAMELVFGPDGIRSSLKSCLRARASHAASDNAMYSASILENATVDCLCADQDTVPPHIKKT